MKIKDGYIVKPLADSFVVVPVQNPDFKSVISLNETGAFLFERMKEETDSKKLVDALLEEYNVSSQIASQDVDAFIDALGKAGLVDE